MGNVTCPLCAEEILGSQGNCPVCGFHLAELGARALPLGTKLQNGKYSVGRKLGEGGFAITYKGAQIQLQRVVAIKELFPEGAIREGTTVHVSADREEFKRDRDKVIEEAQVLANLNAKGIVRVHDTFQENNTAYIVMEYLAGQTLASRIREMKGPVPLLEVWSVADALSETLLEVHNKELLHRDIKPENIILTEDGRTVLIDFGAARKFRLGQTVSHTRMLTVDYAAPEQYSSEGQFGAYTDLYCLGATLYHALTGSPPPSSVERLQQMMESSGYPQPLNFPSTLSSKVPKCEGLCTAIRQAMEMKPKERTQDAAEFHSLLLADLSESENTLNLGSRFLYQFQNQQFETSEELTSSLAQHWEAALKEWSLAGISNWVTDVDTQVWHQRAINSELETDPIFAWPRQYDTAIFSHEFNSRDALRERQLWRVMVVLDSKWIPNYRGTPVGDRQRLQDWVRKATDDSESLSLLRRFILRGLLLGHPEIQMQRIHKDLEKEILRFIAIVSSTKFKDGIALGDIWLDILACLTGLVKVETGIAKIKADRRSMHLSWFRDLVETAEASPGLLAALQTLLPLLRRQRLRSRGIRSLIAAIVLLGSMAVSPSFWLDTTAFVTSHLSITQIWIEGMQSQAVNSLRLRTVPTPTVTKTGVTNSSTPNPPSSSASPTASLTAFEKPSWCGAQESWELGTVNVPLGLRVRTKADRTSDYLATLQFGTKVCLEGPDRADPNSQNGGLLWRRIGGYDPQFPLQRGRGWGEQEAWIAISQNSLKYVIVEQSQE